MSQAEETTRAFETAIITADCEALRTEVAKWFDKDYRTPENALDIAPIVQSAIDGAFALKEDEARRNWRTAEADAWNQARQSFDAAMCAFVERIGKMPNPEPQHDPTPSKWGTQRPAIGAGWNR